MQVWKDYQQKNNDRFLNELLELLRIPSVSAKAENKSDMVNCAKSIEKRLLEAGVDKVEIYPTEGHPIVYGEKIIDPSKPTVLVYGHYDVQPAEPLELWKSGPFDPVIIDGNIFATENLALPLDNERIPVFYDDEGVCRFLKNGEKTADNSADGRCFRNPFTLMINALLENKLEW